MLVSKSELRKLTGMAMPTLTKRLDGIAFIEGERNSQMYESKEVLPILFSPDVGSSYEQERTRLTKAQADHMELQVREKEGELLLAEEVEENWANMVLAMKAKMVNLPSRLASKAIAATDLREIEEYARTEVYSALSELGQNGES